MAYRRQDPAWDFGTSCDASPDPDEDNNFKFLTVSSAGSWFATPYWYHDQTNQKCSQTQRWEDNFFASGGLGAMNDPSLNTIGGSSDQAADPWYEWVKDEYRIGLGSSGQQVRIYRNNRQDVNLTNENTYDESGTNFALSIGTFARQETVNNFIYMVDVVAVVGADAYKRVILTDNATYASSTIVEFQPITSWADTSIGITINKGKLPAGTAHIHVFDETDSVSNEGTLELA
jgi:hypothetical protein